MSYYQCKRCKFTSKFKNDMRRHVSRKIKCGKDLDAYNYSDDELSKLSLIKIVIKEETNKKNLTCNYCNKLYSRLDSLNRHKLSCKNNENSENNIIASQSENQSISIENIFLKSNNFTLKSFDEDWSIEHISEHYKLFILLSQTKYTDFLKEIMRNKENLNIIVEKNTDSVLVYKNKCDGYVNIKKKIFFGQLMIKINLQLQKIFNEYLSEKYNIEKSVLNTIKDEKVSNNTKLSDYLNDNSLKKTVDNLLLNILYKNREDALLVAESIKYKKLTYGY